MSSFDFPKYRELGFGGLEVKLQGANFWSRLNAKICRPSLRPVEHSSRKRKHSGNSLARRKLNESQKSDFQMVSTDELLAEQASLKLPGIFHEHRLLLGDSNKVFTSRWLSDDRIVMGTKCNQLLTYDVKSHALSRIPNLKSSSDSVPLSPDRLCGIHAIHTNPSETLIASGAENPCDVAVYRLADYKPVTVGECAHKDWIFSLQWLDDQFLLSGSRDSTVALWKFDENPAEQVACSHIRWIRPRGHIGAEQLPPYPATKPIKVKKLQQFDKVRAFTYNYRHKIVTSVSLNSYIHVLDVETFSQVRLFKLAPNFVECVCMCNSPDENLMAIGSRTFVAFFDTRSLEQVKLVELPNNPLAGNRFGPILPFGVRSISWHGPLVTLGTGGGEVLFYDVLNDNFLPCECCGRDSEVLQIGSAENRGLVQRDELYNELFNNVDVPDAVYTHCYDYSRTRLFTAGGPISAAARGNFASIWQ